MYFGEKIAEEKNMESIIEFIIEEKIWNLYIDFL